MFKKAKSTVFCWTTLWPSKFVTPPRSAKKITYCVLNSRTQLFLNRLQPFTYHFPLLPSWSSSWLPSRCTRQWWWRWRGSDCLLGSYESTPPTWVDHHGNDDYVGDWGKLKWLFWIKGMEYRWMFKIRAKWSHTYSCFPLSSLCPCRLHCSPQRQKDPGQWDFICLLPIFTIFVQNLSWYHILCDIALYICLSQHIWLLFPSPTLTKTPTSGLSFTSSFRLWSFPD